MNLILLSQSETKKVWQLDDKEVTVWNDFDRCLKCGRPLKNPLSRSIGRGPACRHNPWKTRHAMLVLDIAPFKIEIQI